MAGTTIISKTARDGQRLTINLVETGRTVPYWTLAVCKGSRQLATIQGRPVQLEQPTGDATHGLVINHATRAVVGLTAAEAQQINAAIDAYKTAAAPDPAEVDAAVAALHCKTCDGRLSHFDLEASPLEGHHVNCV